MNTTRLSTDTTKLDAYFEIGQKAARAAGEIQMKHFGERHQIQTKSTRNDLVTEVDKACEEKIREIFGQECPEALILGEETFKDGDPIDLSNTWIVDPIDGTTNYAHNFPHFAVSIAYYQNGEPQIGIVLDAFKNEMFSALKGQGAFLNGKRITVSDISTLEHALLATGFPVDIMCSEDNNLRHFSSVLMQCHSVRRPGSAALDLAYAACGRLDGFWELKLAPWDVAAGIVLIQEAGGVVSDLQGQPLSIAQRRVDIVGASGPALLNELTAILNCKV